MKLFIKMKRVEYVFDITDAVKYSWLYESTRMGSSEV